MAKFITAKEAAQLIPDGAVVGLAGMGLSVRAISWFYDLSAAIPYTGTVIS